MPTITGSDRPGTTLARAGSVIPLVIAAAALLLRFPARVMECDAVIYASKARCGDVAALCNPGHLAYGFLERAALLIGQRMSPPLSPIFLLQYVSMAAALLGLYFFHRALTEAKLGRARALVFTTVFFLSYGYWHYATQGESYVLATAFVTAFLWRFIRFLRAPSVRGGIVAGAMLAAATIMHQTSILVLPAALIGALFPTGRANRAAPICAFAATAIAASALPYLVLGWTVLGLRSHGGYRDWIMGLSKWGWWSGWSIASPIKAAVGFTRSFVGSHFLLRVGAIESFAKTLFPLASWEDELAVAAHLPRGLAALLAAAEVWVLGVAAAAVARRLRTLRRVFATDRGLTVFLVAWLLIIGVFFMWWCPQRAEFWIPLFPPLLLLLALPGVARLRHNVKAVWITAAVLAALFAVNFWGSIYPQSLDRMEPDTLAALAIEAAVEPGDVVISDSGLWGRATQFVRAFHKVNLMDLRIRTASRRGGTSVADHGERVLAVVDSVLGEAERRGKAVYLLATPLSTDEETATRYEGLTAAIAERFDISEGVAVRAAIDVRRVRHRGEPSGGG